MLAMQTWEPKFDFWCTLIIPVLKDTGKQRQKDSSGLTDKRAQPEQRALVPVRDSVSRKQQQGGGQLMGKDNEVHFRPVSMCMCTAIKTS